MASRKKITRKDITPKMFEKWKDECRNDFSDGEDQYNLINICLKGLDASNTAKDKKCYNASLMKFFENDLVHQGKLFCEHCGEPMEVYYDAHCFRCRKPKGYNYLMMKKLDVS